jgi:hypothetical protein
MPQAIDNVRSRPRKARRSARGFVAFFLVLLAGFAGGFAWNLTLLPQVTRNRDAYQAAAECRAAEAGSESTLPRASDAVCRYSNVQVTFKWAVSGRYSTSYHVSLRDQDGTVYPNVILNRAVFWKTTQVSQSLNAQIINGKVTMLRSPQATVMTTDHPYSRLYLVRMRILIFGGVAGLMLIVLRRSLRQYR